MRPMADTLYIVVPCYNEEAVLPETARRLRAKLEALMAADKISEKSRVLFVNDGSRDGTWGVIQGLHGACPLFSGVDLSRNRAPWTRAPVNTAANKSPVPWNCRGMQLT